MTSTFQLKPVNPAFFSFDPVPGSSTFASKPHLECELAPAAQSTSTSSSSSRFAPLKTDSEVEQAKASAAPLNTRKNTG